MRLPDYAQFGVELEGHGEPHHDHVWSVGGDSSLHSCDQCRDTEDCRHECDDYCLECNHTHNSGCSAVACDHEHGESCYRVLDYEFNQEQGVYVQVSRQVEYPRCGHRVESYTCYCVAGSSCQHEHDDECSQCQHECDSDCYEGGNTFEIRSHVLAGEADLEQLLTAVRSVQPYVHAGTDCGLHVHIDIRTAHMAAGLNTNREYGVTFNTLLDYYDYWWSTLLGMVDRSRRNNEYCKRVPSDRLRGVTDDTVLYDAIYSAIEDRYYALNIHAFLSHGTVEFRLHHGTFDDRVIGAWVRVCWAFMNAAVLRRPLPVVSGETVADLLDWLGVDESVKEVYHVDSATRQLALV